MKRIKIFLGLGLILLITQGYTQVAISDNASADPDPASILDLQSSSRGFLMPRMLESQKNSITNPATGLIIYQTDGADGIYYNVGTPASPNWNLISDDETSVSGGGHWTKAGDDIYYSGGKVGIETSSPGAAFEVAGAAWFNDSIAINGGKGHLFINAASPSEPTIRLAQDNATIYKLKFRTGDGFLGDPYFMLNSDQYSNIWGVTSWGRVRQDYKGNYQAHLIYSSADRSAFFIDNDNTFAGAKCINATISSTTSHAESVTINSFNNGEGTALYAENGKYNNFGHIGTNLYGVYGENASSGFWGAIGSNSSALYGQLGDGVSAQSLSAGDFAVKGIGVETGGQNGTGYLPYETLGGIMGYNPVGTQFSFGVTGYVGASPADQAGGIFGSYSDASAWGSLAYTSSSSSHYAGYFTSTSFGSGTGKSQAGTFSNIGIGVWGDLIGADIHGNVYGLYAQGANYSVYANGDVYRTGADVHVQENASGENSVMYTLVSTEMVVQTYGIGTLQKGKSNIEFDAAFAEVVSPDKPIIVTITPIGKSKGVYLDAVTDAGFSVGENDHGKSDVQFSWIAIGTRKGFENKQLPAEVIASDYNEKMQRGLANDNDEVASGEGLYYKDGQLYNGHIQQPKSAGTVPVVEKMTKKPSIEPELSEDIEEDTKK